MSSVCLAAAVGGVRLMSPIRGVILIIHWNGCSPFGSRCHVDGSILGSSRNSPMLDVCLFVLLFLRMVVRANVLGCGNSGGS